MPLEKCQAEFCFKIGYMHGFSVYVFRVNSKTIFHQLGLKFQSDVQAYLLKHAAANILCF